MIAFFEYFRNITYYLVFLTVVGMLAPSDGYRAYIRLIMGILLIGVVVGPIATMLNRQNVSMPEIFEASVPVMAEQSGHLKNVFHDQLSTQAKAMLARENFTLISANWETAEDFTYIRRVRMTVKVAASEPERVPFIRIEPVRVAPYRPLDPEDTPKEALQVKKLISDFYDMYVGNIHVDIQKE